jgi:phage tail sheath protein FI
MTYSRPGVYINERQLPATIATTGTANAAGAVLGEFAQGPEVVTLVTSWYDFVQKFGGYNASFPATFGVGLYFQNGGSELYVKRVLAANAAQAAVTIAPATGTTPVGTITAKNKGADGNNLRVQFSAISGGLVNLVVYKEGGSNSDNDAANDVIVERFNSLSMSDSAASNYIESVVNTSSQFINIDVTSTVAAPATSRLPLTGGTNGSDVEDTDFTGAISSFSAVDRPLVLFAPSIIDVLGGTDGKTVQDALISWAASNNGFAVVDTDADLTPAEAVNYSASLQDTSYAALYYPHIYMADPLGRSSAALRRVGPAGAVAGMYIQTDKQVGPFKAPAGLNSQLRGAVAVERAFTSAELDSLNNNVSPVNAIRNLPGAGVVAMGARTLLQDGTANRYVNMRRSLIYIRKYLKDLTEFALFENNNEKLWAQLRTTITVFLTSYLNQGGLRGTIPAEAFYVKCDGENNSDATIANGEVHIEVGVALQYPAEFIVINLTQTTAA